MLFYCPLEAYKERYTSQLAAPKTGWFERNWIKYGVEFTRVDGGDHTMDVPINIAQGVALDAVGRGMVCMSQIKQLLSFVYTGKLKHTDVIYFDDFWHPGIEAIAYAFESMNRPIPAMYANCWAQSVDIHDFTYPMRSWMRHYERGNAEILRGIFVACPTLRDLVRDQIGDNVYVVGHPWSTEEVQGRLGDKLPVRENKVVFSSRLDKEKRPMLMLQIADKVLSTMDNVSFVICSGAQGFKSNCDNRVQIKQLIDALMDKYNGRFRFEYNLTKEQYYWELQTAKVQLNTSLQDWISYTLLEASAFGCYPVYPHYRSFPEVLRHDQRFLYADHQQGPQAVEKTVAAAVKKIETVIWSDTIANFNDAALTERAWIHERYDTTWLRMLDVMGLWNERIESEFKRQEVWAQTI